MLNQDFSGHHVLCSLLNLSVIMAQNRIISAQLFDLCPVIIEKYQVGIVRIIHGQCSSLNPILEVRIDYSGIFSHNVDVKQLSDVGMNRVFFSFDSSYWLYGCSN